MLDIIDIDQTISKEVFEVDNESTDEVSNSNSQIAEHILEPIGPALTDRNDCFDKQNCNGQGTQNCNGQKVTT